MSEKTSTQDQDLEVQTGKCASEIMVRRNALTAGPCRQLLLEQHPLHEKVVKIVSPPMRRAIVQTTEAIKFKRPGLGFYAEWRFGKTTMIIMISEAIRELLPTVAVGVVTAQSHDKLSDKILWTDVLHAFHLKQYGTASDRKDTLRNGIIAACQRAGGTQFAWFVDEAQTWKEGELTLLRDLTNELELVDKITITTILVGDPALKKIRDSLIVGRKDLWSRFFRALYPYSGLTSVDDLKKFMAEYDNSKRCEYPAASGICYTEFFLPAAYAAGWRLADQAPALWSALELTAKKANSTLTEIGMNWIGECILHVLTLEMPNDDSKFYLESANWEDAVLMSLFSSSFL